jgi:hypothetical protein
MKLSAKIQSLRFFSLIAIGALLVSSCKSDFLEITPKGVLLLSTTNDYSLALNSLDLINMNTDAQIPLSDEAAALNANFNTASLRTQRLFRWEDEVYQPGEPAPEMTVPMRNIYLYNTIINGVENSTGGTEAERNSILAEALAGRAFVNFLLVNYYGKPYNGTSSNTDLGIPLIVESDVTTNIFTRATVKQVYDQIVHDLNTAIPLLPQVPFWRVRMSRSAGQAILAKVYMYMGKYDEAIPLLNSSFENLKNSSIPIRLYNYNTDMRAGGVLAPLANGYPPLITIVNNTEVVYGRQFPNRWSGASGAAPYEILLSPAAYALFGQDDLRTTFFSNRLPSNAIMPSNLRVRKYPVVTNQGVNLPEMYLLRAECKARSNDLTGAVSDLVTLRSSRMPASSAIVPSSIAQDRSKLIPFIFEEKTREFALTGFRWFDMRRLSVDSEFSTLVNKMHVLYSDNGTIQSTYTLKSERLILRFPELVISRNPGMPNNP